MPPEKGDSAYLWDMLDAARGVCDSLTGRNLEQYLDDENLRLATERRIEIIGEAARRVSQVFREMHAEIPWQKIMGQRHVLAHDYGDIDHELIWNVATRRIPELIHALEAMNLTPPSESAE